MNPQSIDGIANKRKIKNMNFFINLFSIQRTMNDLPYNGICFPWKIHLPSDHIRQRNDFELIVLWERICLENTHKKKKRWKHDDDESNKISKLKWDNYDKRLDRAINQLDASM